MRLFYDFIRYVFDSQPFVGAKNAKDIYIGRCYTYICYPHFLHSDVSVYQRVNVKALIII